MMMGFMGKRKELEQVVDGLCDFSLSGPAAKCRRLDPGLPPILEEELPCPSIPYQHQMLGEEINSGINMPIVEDMIEGAMPSHLSSEDKALVIYKPVNKPTLFGLSIANPSIIVSSDLIRGLKNQPFNQGNCHGLEDNSPERSNCLALVPWTPQRIAMTSDWSASPPESTQNAEEPMDADETEVISMDFEEAPQATPRGIDVDNIHQWHQHCMDPPSLPNASAPVMWSW
ncbi:uncharacterized protein [Aegilops tauschii subsp. strangulata]|nr:uncharacterized protein LOC109740426 [Aegilops tauschii subsp. strangulata]XP_044418662.1 uncharacterized protein LOC123143754 [Triticum aestivum]